MSMVGPSEQGVSYRSVGVDRPGAAQVIAGSASPGPGGADAHRRRLRAHTRSASLRVQTRSLKSSVPAVSPVTITLGVGVSGTPSTKQEILSSGLTVRWGSTSRLAGSLPASRHSRGTVRSFCQSSRSTRVVNSAFTALQAPRWRASEGRSEAQSVKGRHCAAGNVGRNPGWTTLAPQNLSLYPPASPYRVKKCGNF